MRLSSLLLVAAMAAADAELVVQRGHAGRITGCAFHPKGEVVATGSADGTVKIWELATGRVLLTLPEPHGQATGLAWLPRDRLLVGMVNGISCVWDVPGAALLHRRDHDRGGYCDVAANADGSLLACGADEICSVLDGEKGAVVRAFPGPDRERFWDLALLPGGELLAAAGDATVFVWRIGDGSEAAAPLRFEGRVTRLESHPDGRRLVACVEGKAVASIDWRAGTTLRRHEGPFVACALSPDGALLALGREDGAITLARFADGKEERSWPAHGDWVRSLAFSPDGARLLSGGDDGRAFVWDVATGAKSRELKAPALHAQAVGAGAAGAALVAFRDGERLRVLDFEAPRTVWVSTDKLPPRSRVVFDPKATHIAYGAPDEPLRVCALESGEVRVTPARMAGAIAVGPGGRLVAAREGADAIAVWDGKERRVLPGNETTDILGLAFDPEGRLLLEGGKGNFLALLDVATAKRVVALEGGAGWVMSLALSRDGETLLCGGPWSQFTVRRRADLGEVRALLGHRGSVASVAFSRDERHLLSAGGEGEVRVWDAAQGAHLATLHVFEGGEWILAAPDGRYDASPGAAAHAGWRVAGALRLDPAAARKPTPGLARALLAPADR